MRSGVEVGSVFLKMVESGPVFSWRSDPNSNIKVKNLSESMIELILKYLLTKDLSTSLYVSVEELLEEAMFGRKE